MNIIYKKHCKVSYKAGHFKYGKRERTQKLKSNSVCWNIKIKMSCREFIFRFHNGTLKS